MAVDSASSHSSGVTGGDLPGFFDQEEISNLEFLEKDAMSSEWTDEKHSLYLKSIENSFVQQLYSSMESSGFRSHNKHCSYMRSSEQNKSRPAHQFKVDQHGFWQRIKIGRGEPPPKKAGKSRVHPQNPWTIPGSTSYGDEPMSFGERTVYTHALANISDDFDIYQTIGDSNTREEFSGQNFDEEERTCSLRTAKRMKMVDAIAENPE